MDGGELLRMSLSTAVPLWIVEFKQLPWEKLERIATEASQYIAEHGDDILFKSKKKGDTAKAFNQLAKGVAVLAFVPGGVKTLGLHFEALHPDVLEGVGRWLYHSTLADALQGIADHGLAPDEKRRWGGMLADWAQGKVFFTGTIPMAAGYARMIFRENLESQGWSWDPVLLRVHSTHLGDIEQDRQSFDDWYVERKVPAIFLQVWVPQKEAWIEVREAVKQGYFEEFQTKYGEPGELDVDPEVTPGEYADAYIKQFWPKE